MEIRPPRAGEEEGIRALFGTCFGKEMSPEHWEWKYRRSPGGSAAMVAVDGGEVVAHYGGLRQVCRYRGRRYVGFQGVDIMTHPRWRGRPFGTRGVLVRLAEAFFEATPMDFFFGFPSERHARLNRLLLGYEPHRRVTVLRREVPSEGRPPRGCGSGWEGAGSGELDRLWRRSRDPRTLTIDKGSAYLRWRYRDKPGGGYRVLTLRGARGRLRGWAALGREGQDLRVLDFLARGRRDGDRLFRAAEAAARELGARRLVLWASPREAACRRLGARGYRAGEGIPYIVKLLDGELPGPLFMDAYAYRLGDYDAV